MPPITTKTLTTTLWLASALIVLIGLATSAFAQIPPPTPVQILEMEGPAGAVEVLLNRAPNWQAAQVSQILQPGDRVRTLERARATLRWSDNTTVRLAPLSDLQVELPPNLKQPGFNLLQGLLYFFHREGPTDGRFHTRTAAAAIRGTEFLFEFIEPAGRTTVTVLEGEVNLSNSLGQIRLLRDEQGIAEPGAPPRKTAVLELNQAIQMFLYYPGVLDLEDLGLTQQEQTALAQSLESYRSGDLLAALANYPVGRAQPSAQEIVYHAAVWLAVGAVTNAEQLLVSLPASSNAGKTARISGALKTMIEAVRTAGRKNSDAIPPELATEWLARSYAEQARWDLTAALKAAHESVLKSPRFGLGWARVAELQFSFGRIREARQALNKSLSLSPRNAQAVALNGFALAAQDKIEAAQQEFDRAIVLDAGLANAWLGRGLCKLRRGLNAEGKDDLQVAATVEPQRALLRSYLGKSYTAAGDDPRAEKELRLAKQKDPADPTAWLYSALLNQRQNRVNEAVEDLERSQELNDNRQVYRSRLLLDRDRGVRGANLASIYRDAGMPEVSVREAARAVNVDPANYSAHLFLANSYYEALDDRQYNQRYETARVSEYLTAALLAPVGAGLVSQPVSAQEYSRFFEQDGLGLYSSTEYSSRGAWQQYLAQYGRFGNLGYSLDGFYRSDPGQRPNNDLEQRSVSADLKFQLTPADSIYLQTVWTRANYGDLAQVYDPATQGNRVVRSTETQEPLLLAGYHHEWSPGNHSLFLAGRLQDTLSVENPQQTTLLISHLDPITFDFTNAITGVTPMQTQQRYQSELTIYTIEAQQILERDAFALIGGGRYQSGHFDTRNEQTIPANPGLPPPEFFQNSPQQIRSGLERFNAYGYAHWQVASPIRLIAGLNYDHLRHPSNFRAAPISNQENTTDALSPKAGLIWTPVRHTVVRAAYGRSLGGVSLEQSFQLEPSQLAGFNQSWRSLIPESVAGTSEAAKYEQWNLSLEHKFPSRTYLGFSGEILRSKTERTIGAFEIGQPDFNQFPVPPFILPSGTPERSRYEERSLLFSVNQLLAQEWSVGARYRLSQADLDRTFPGVPASASQDGGFQRNRHELATLHNLDLYGTYAHRLGAFAMVEALWWRQSNVGYAGALPRADFWQFNASAGWRFAKRRAELRAGLLNISGQDYRMNPLNLVSEIPRRRTFVTSLRFSF